MINNFFQLSKDQDMTDDFVSAYLPVDQQVVGSIQAVWAGTPTGTLILQATSDPSYRQGGSVTWSTLDDTSVSLTGAVGDKLWVLDNIGYLAVRVSYDASSSTGTITIEGVSKGV